MRPFARVLLAAGVLRIALLGWGSYQDRVSAVKYTDVDYFVFSDAANCLAFPALPDCSIAKGPLRNYLSLQIGDPYARDTYRYTPILALLALPNVLLHPTAAKVLFAFADLVVGSLLYSELLRKGVREPIALRSVAIIWLLNPIIANISTRGSAESILGLLVVGTLVLLERGRLYAAAALFGLAVHFKIYPVIYGSSIFVFITAREGNRLITKAHLLFGVISFASFMSLNLVMFAIWGEPFIQHTFLYHISRLDHRHNFSPYFYPFYLLPSASPLSTPRTNDLLTTSLELLTKLVRNPLAGFIPQLSLSVGLGFVYGKDDLGFAWFVQTVSFVTFNKVCTSQYFLWYLWLLPLAIPSLSLTQRESTTLILIWILSQALWLSQAYRLEMLGEANYIFVWYASVGFFASNCWILGRIIRAYRPVKRRIEGNEDRGKRKVL